MEKLQQDARQTHFATYEEALAAYPDCDHVVTVGPDWGDTVLPSGGIFAPINSRGRFCGQDYSGPVMGDVAYIIADKPPEKPSYTKEMHEAGEFKNGDKVQVPSQGDAVLTFIGASAKYKTCILEFDDGSTAYELVEFIRHADIRTDEQKLIDEACSEMLAIDATPIDSSEKAIIELMIKAGYRKP